MQRRAGIYVTALIAAPMLLHAAGTETRRDISDYSVRSHLNQAEMGVDFLGHYIPVRDGQIFSSPDYIAVEVAVFSKSKDKLMLHANQFSLKLNSETLMPVKAGYVSLPMVVPELKSEQPHAEVDASAGPVVYTSPQPQIPRRLPDDNGAGTPLPGQLTLSQDQIMRDLQDLALPEGEHTPPVSGYLYFPYPKKLKKIKHLTLLYSGPMGESSSPLR